MTTQTRKLTAYIAVAVTAVLIGWDIYAAMQQEAGTISEVLAHAFWRFPTLAFATGIIMGHWTWPAETTRPGLQTGFIVGGVAAALIILEYLAVVPRPDWLIPVIPLILGILAGHWVWPQRRGDFSRELKL